MSARRRPVGKPPRQKPYPRTYPNGRRVWVARYYDLDGKPQYAKPRWNGGKSSFAREGAAQRAIDEALAVLYGTAEAPRKLGEYSEYWLEEHPRSTRTNKTNTDLLSYVLDTVVEGRPLREWEFDELRRRHALKLVDHMFRVEGRAAKGARGLLSVLSAMAEDAIGDDAATANAFLGVKLRSNDPRIQKPARKSRVWTFEQMRRLAMLLTPGYTGLRLGEVLALLESGFDGVSFEVEASGHEGELIDSSDGKNHERTVPCPPTLAELILQRPDPPEGELLFPTPTGRLFRERNFYRDV